MKDGGVLRAVGEPRAPPLYGFPVYGDVDIDETLAVLLQIPFRLLLLVRLRNIAFVQDEVIEGETGIPRRAPKEGDIAVFTRPAGFVRLDEVYEYMSLGQQ